MVFPIDFPSNDPTALRHKSDEMVNGEQKRVLNLWYPGEHIEMYVKWMLIPLKIWKTTDNSGGGRLLVNLNIC